MAAIVVHLADGAVVKVLFVTHRLAGGGAERVMAGLASGLAARGHAVEILLLENREINEYPVHKDVRIQALNLGAASGNPFMGLAANLRRVFALRKAVRNSKPDVVAGVLAPVAVTVALACAGLSCRTIGCEHTYPPNALNSRTWRMARVLAYPLLDVVTVLTEGSAAWVHRHLLCKEVRVIPNWAKRQEISSEEAATVFATVPKDARVVLGVGRLHPLKGFGRLISAFDRVFADDAAWSLVILGDGPLRAELEAQISNAGLEGRVLLPGSTRFVGNWYDRADIFVLCSSLEGFPNVLVEALAHGVASVSFDCREGPRDIIQDGVNGFLIPDGDDEALADALIRLKDDEALRMQLAAKGAGVVSVFSEAHVLDLWEGLLRTCASSQSPLTTLTPKIGSR